MWILHIDGKLQSQLNLKSLEVINYKESDVVIEQQAQINLVAF